MLHHLSVRSFQSLRNVELDLGQFTVIVGASSAGKSALLRACRALASNVRGSGVITRGQKAMAITAHTDTHTITLERSAEGGSYRLIDAAGTEDTFTKLNGGVPEPITRALRLEPVPATGTSVNFASQFDRPYLLDDSGATIARVLAELTNVNIIFEAVRAANKVRMSAASTLKTRKTDLTALTAQLSGFQGLPDRFSALQSAEKLAEQGRTCSEALERLDKALKTLQIAETALERASKLPTVPSALPMGLALTRYRDLKAAVDDLIAKNIQARLTDHACLTASLIHDGLMERLSETLAQAGVCPTCGQSTVKPDTACAVEMP